MKLDKERLQRLQESTYVLSNGVNALKHTNGLVDSDGDTLPAVVREGLFNYYGMADLTDVQFSDWGKYREVLRDIKNDSRVEVEDDGVSFPVIWNLAGTVAISFTDILESCTRMNAVEKRIALRSIGYVLGARLKLMQTNNKGLFKQFVNGIKDGSDNTMYLHVGYDSNPFTRRALNWYKEQFTNNEVLKQLTDGELKTLAKDVEVAVATILLDRAEKRQA